MSADGAIALTRELVGLDTANPPGNEALAARLVAARLEAAGLAVRRHDFAPGRTSVVARWAGRTEAPALCLTGHLDTVPLGARAWEHDPLGGELDGDRLYGRGTSDMKAGVAAIVLAAERIAALGRGRAGLELVLCAGEETGCEGARALAAHTGMLGRVGALLVAEPTSNYPCVAHKGVVWLDAIAHGRTAHGSMPHLGDNAIHTLARAIVDLQRFRLAAPRHPLLDVPTFNVGTVCGGMNINSVPDRAHAGLDVRTTPGLDADAVLDQLASTVGPDIALSIQLALNPIDTDPDDPWVQEVFEIMAPVCGEAPAARGLAYFTDAAALVSAYGTPPVLICGPGDPDHAHRTDESCSITAVRAAVEAIFEIARRWCGL
ncbi:MAG: M20 family metallopeptidase [Solirubrobacterales bacterium]|nr:M20 family metallopeptidase [Solirubrobacterales bacterium]